MISAASFSSRVRAALVLFVCTCAAPALAQDGSQPAPPAGSPRPFRGLFGGANADAEGGLDLLVSLQGAYDDDVTGRSTNAASARSMPTVGGYFTAASADLTYDRPGDRLSLGAIGRAGTSYYPDFSDLSGWTYFGSATAALSLGRFRTTLLQSAGKSPFYSFVFMPVPIEEGMPAPTDPIAGLNVLRRESVWYQTRVSISQQLTARTSISAAAGYRRADFSTQQADLTSRSGSVRISRNFTKYLGLSAGYGVNEGRYSDGRVWQTRDISVGTNYNRPLSKTRRTFLSLSSGTSSAEDARRGTSYRFTGSAGLRHQMGRSWNASVDYNRGIRYLEGFGEPFFTDSVRGLVRGFLTRRVDVDVQAGYSSGTIGLTANALPFASYFGTTSARYALSRIAALQVQYLFYHYDFEREPTSDLPREFDRHGVRVGFNLWLPLF